MKYEDIFTQNKTGTNYTFYNILKTVNFPKNLPSSIVMNYTVTGSPTFATLSYKIYGTTTLWWLICLVNDIQNPVKLLTPGTTIKVVRPNQLDNVLKQIQSKV